MYLKGKMNSFALILLKDWIYNFTALKLYLCKTEKCFLYLIEEKVNYKLLSKCRTIASLCHIVDFLYKHVMLI